MQLSSERDLYAYWTAKCNNTLTSIIDYLQNIEGRTAEVPAVLNSYMWAAARYTAYYAWYVNATNGNLNSINGYNRYAAVC